MHAEGAGGMVRFLLSKGDVAACTHVIARHAEQPSARWAAEHSVQAVSHFWVWECTEARQLLQTDDPVLPIDLPLLCLCRSPSLRVETGECVESVTYSFWFERSCALGMPQTRDTTALQMSRFCPWLCRCIGRRRRPRCWARAACRRP